MAESAVMILHDLLAGSPVEASIVVNCRGWGVEL
jgi:hypothetical protein